MAMIRINLCRDPKSGRNYRAVYLGKEHVASFWRLAAAMDCAERLAKISGAAIHCAVIIPFSKAVA